MNSLTAYALGPLLNKRLKNCVIKGVYQYPNLVTISLSGGWHSFLHIFHSGFEPELVPSNSLIANIQYSVPIFQQATDNKIIDVKTLGTDRIILITIRSSESWSGDINYILRFDFIPSNSPVTLFNGETGGVISTVNSSRSNAPTSPHNIPPARPFSLLSLPNEKPSGFLATGGVSQESPDKNKNLVVKLFNSISGLDPLLAEAIVTESNGNPDSIWIMAHKISEKLKKGQFKWHIYQLSESDNIKSAIYPLSLPVGNEIARTESYSEAMRLHTELSILPLFIQELRQKAAKAKRKELKRLKRLSGNLSKDLDKASRHEEFSLYGNLLSTHYNRIKKGMKKITLPDFSGTKEITIPLDSALEPKQNVQHYFKKAKKGKKGLKKITNRLKPVEERSAQLSDSLEELLRLTTPDELLKLIPSQKDSSFPRKGRSPERFKQFVLNKHYTVYVGRSAKENDLLTHKFASRQDLWFHAKGVPGSHVILKGANKSTPPNILKTAASIAAYYSKSRHSKIAPVTCTEKKYVSKPRKSPPGTASIQRETVFFVNPSIPSSD